MTAWPLVKLVQAPEPDARVRLDLNSADRWGAPGTYVDADAFSLGYPVLDGEPTAVGASYSYRTIEGVVWIGGNKAEALSVQAALWRELSRPSSWLLFQLSPLVKPVWAKIFRSYSDAPLSLDQVDASSRKPDAWRIPLTLTAEALLYGERETLGPVTITQSLTGDYPMRWDLPPIKGDAPTALRITIAPDEGYWYAARVGVAASEAIDDLVTDIGLGDGFTAGSGTAAGSSDADYLGGSYRTVTIGTGANFVANRLSGPLVTPPAGRYTVLLRCEADPIDSVTPNRYLFALGQAGASRYGPTVTLDTPFTDPTAHTFQGWVNLGDFTFPVGVNLPAGVTAPQAAPSIVLKVGTAAENAGVVRLDAIMLIPIGGQAVIGTSVIQTGDANGSQLLTGEILTAVWDGDSESFWQTLVSDGTVFDDQDPVPHMGAFPAADPSAVQNRMTILPDLAAVTSATGEAEVTVSYHPRYLHLPGEAATP